jgi:hypothetical protein
VTDDQVESGIRKALSRVEAEGVFVEGNSFAQFVDVDLFVMVRRADETKIKKSAKQMLAAADTIYVSGEAEQNLLQLIDAIRGLVREGISSAVA